MHAPAPVLQMRQRAEASGRKIRAADTEVLVASIGNGLQPRRMGLASQLWAAGIKAEFGYKANPKMGDQLGAALEQGIPFMVGDGQLMLSRVCSHGVCMVCAWCGGGGGGGRTAVVRERAASLLAITWCCTHTVSHAAMPRLHGSCAHTCPCRPPPAGAVR